MGHGGNQPDPLAYPRACLFSLLWGDSLQFTINLVLAELRAFVLPLHPAIPADLATHESSARHFDSDFHGLVEQRARHVSIPFFPLPTLERLLSNSCPLCFLQVTQPYLSALFQNRSRAQRLLIGDVLARSISFLNWVCDFASGETKSTSKCSSHANVDP